MNYSYGIVGGLAFVLNFLSLNFYINEAQADCQYRPTSIGIEKFPYSFALGLSEGEKPIVVGRYVRRPCSDGRCPNYTNFAARGGRLRPYSNRPFIPRAVNSTGTSIGNGYSELSAVIVRGQRLISPGLEVRGLSAINEAGIMLGGQFIISLQRDGTLSKTHFFPEAYSASGSDINDVGDIVGVARFSASGLKVPIIKTANSIEILQSVGSLPANPIAINNNRQVVGKIGASYSLPEMSVLWTGGELKVLSDINDPAEDLDVSDINDSGDIVGSKGGNAIIIKDGQIYDLNQITCKLRVNLVSVARINNAGLILAEAKTKSGRRKAILLKPTHG